MLLSASLMQPVSLKRIIVFCLPGIGDTILFTPALAWLRRAYPSAHIVMLTMFQGTREAVSTNPDVDEVRHFDFFNARKWEGIRYVWNLRRERFDLSIMAFPSNRLEYNVLNCVVGRRWRAAHRYDHQSWRNLWFLNNIVVREDRARHNVEENLRLMGAIADRVGTETPLTEVDRGPAPALKVVLTAEDEQYADQFLASRGIEPDTMLFGFHTYSSTFKNMHRKCWDKDNFAQLIARLTVEHPSARCLVFSGPHEEAVNRYILDHVDGRVVEVRESRLRRALALMKRCRVFITNDSGPMHLATAIGAPVVALFGPTDWRRLHPWSDRHLVVRRDLPCMPCFYYSTRSLHCVANLDYACMRDITVDEVLVAVRQLLAQTHAKPAIAQT